MFFLQPDKKTLYNECGGVSKKILLGKIKPTTALATVKIVEGVVYATQNHSFVSVLQKVNKNSQAMEAASRTRNSVVKFYLALRKSILFFFHDPS